MQLWGMQGVVLLLFAIGAVLIANYFVKKPFLKFIPVSKTMAGLIGLGLVVYAGSQTMWWGLSVPGITPTEEQVTPGATFEVEGSETDANLVYDSATRTFTCAFYENLASGGPAEPIDDGATAITTVTLTVTLFRTDYIAGENATTKITTSIPKFHGKAENESITYSPIAKTSDGEKYNVTLTPAGGSARYEYTYLSVGAAGSKATVIVVTLSATGCAQFDNFDSQTMTISTAGGPVYLRFTKTGEYTA